MSRLKLILLVLIIAILGIVFVQNREPLALKLLCADPAESCFYQTRRLPLAIWMGLFIVAGILTSLLSQLLDRYRYAGVGRTRSNANNFDEEEKWSMRSNRSEQYPTASDRIQDSSGDKYTSGVYEAPQKPESVERSGSTYSYKYRDASPEFKSDASPKDNNARKTSIDSEIDSKLDRDKDDEDWI